MIVNAILREADIRGKIIQKQNSEHVLIPSEEHQLNVEASRKKYQFSVFSTYERLDVNANLQQQIPSRASIASIIHNYPGSAERSIIWALLYCLSLKCSSLKCFTVYLRSCAIYLQHQLQQRIFSHSGLFTRPHRARLGNLVLSQLVNTYSVTSILYKFLIYVLLLAYNSNHNQAKEPV